MNRKVILSCAVTGAGETAEKSPHVPVTPKEIADSAIKAAKAGATIAHIHVRDPKSGKLSHDVQLFQEVVERIRESDTDVVLNLTAGGGGDWLPSEADPTKGGKGTDIQTPEERHEPVGLLLPEICTLDCGSVNFGDQIYISPATWLRKQAKLIKESGVKPELECFDTGHIRFANQLLQEGLIDGDPMYQFCLGIPWGADADAETLAYMKNRLPENAKWAAFGIGKMQLPMVTESVVQGGNARVGLEDNLYLKKGKLATNEQLVDKAVEKIQGLGHDVMNPQEAREYLKLRNPYSKGE
ncbi:MAG: 3-keto-5-aminohexanoate cleavage protein [Bacillota bacterium]|uniref:3-keto-5-aminohexanoate cleavage protein n=1 Tax=Virgibacillus salarius TaxID=447199 RepID=A0A941I8Q0_9BACI|nr:MULTISPECIES: 3-keto-5-aminohexanoate cleavage protein [Virgibacillus]NAZ07409.1 3-keto-5-aminohexanoate cleavage protein [Agaribacter marinus]MBR7794688.1 3-keto-5-aminohexanoate cleavage protein [Virgibacillus salarius]MCC2248366.1 3-keto-5-aminohexanoate cleavage protein [Virgibacillus sp. AGTR]MDY7045225.1 3-keto-5-aminohexanoate cleavage protein [Virgibacillus sp. M23]QRZ16418.1 3-keto-5-aminohexanoate cleavage protein [Virgibacillus sp. AGTR]